MEYTTSPVETSVETTTENTRKLYTYHISMDSFSVVGHTRAPPPELNSNLLFSTLITLFTIFILTIHRLLIQVRGFSKLDKWRFNKVSGLFRNENPIEAKAKVLTEDGED